MSYNDLLKKYISIVKQAQVQGQKKTPMEAVIDAMLNIAGEQWRGRFTMKEGADRSVRIVDFTQIADSDVDTYIKPHLDKILEAAKKADPRINKIFFYYKTGGML